MRESVDSQIVIGTTEAFFPVEGLGLKNVGRKRLINRDKYLDAVKKVLSISDTYVSRYLGVDRTTVWRYRKSNPDVVFESLEYLKEMSYLDLSPKLMYYENFLNIQSIIRFKEIMERKRVGKRKINTKLRSIFYMCKYLKVHPQKATPEQVADIVNEMRDRKIIGEKVPKGLSFLTQREAWRGYFQSVKGIAGQILTDLGIDAHESFGAGRYSKQRLTKQQRHDFEIALKEVCMENDLTHEDYLELIMGAKFMYYSGTRRTATFIFNFSLQRFELREDVWMIGIIDKGRDDVVLKDGSFKRGKEWEKLFIGYALESLKDYFIERFGLNRDKLERDIPKKVKWMFPNFYNKIDYVTKLYRKAHKKAGYKGVLPVHIFRHTFAQDCLDATDWNYELVASIGGWISTRILKKHYGEMGRSKRLKGLQKAMGMPVEEEIHELKF